MSVYVSVSLSVSALITQQVAQYSSVTFPFCLSVSFYLALSSSVCSAPHQSQSIDKDQEKEVLSEKSCLSVCISVCVCKTFC